MCEVGGWVLVLTCECGASETFRAVVPTLATDRAARTWTFEGGPMVRPYEERIGACPARH